MLFLHDSSTYLFILGRLPAKILTFFLWKSSFSSFQQLWQLLLSLTTAFSSCWMLLSTVGSFDIFNSNRQQSIIDYSDRQGKLVKEPSLYLKSCEVLLLKLVVSHPAKDWIAVTRRHQDHQWIVAFIINIIIITTTLLDFFISSGMHPKTSVSEIVCCTSLLMMHIMTGQNPVNPLCQYLDHHLHTLQ